MKKSILLLAVMITGISGCSVIDELRTFEVPYSISVTIPSNGIISLPIDLPTTDIETNTEQKFETEGVQKEWVDEIRLKSARATITDPSNKTFSFLEKARVYISGSNAPEILLASKDPVPENVGGEMDLEVTSADLFTYLEGESFDLRANFVTDETILQDVTVKIDIVGEVKATIPK